MSDPARAVRAARQAVALFEPERGLLAVEGGDRLRWLDGMISADVSALAPGPRRSGAYALFLTPKGRIVADLHVLQLGDSLWLDLAAEAATAVLERLEGYVVADDVTLRDLSTDWGRLCVEGPSAVDVLARAGAEAVVELAPGAWSRVRVGETELLLAAYGWSGEPGFQLFAARGAVAALRQTLRQVGARYGLVEGDLAALEILRVEAGIPKLGAELDEQVLPAEAGLTEVAICFDKGCYVGQEIVARLDARGRVQHRLVGLRFESIAEAGQSLRAQEREVGEVTSACLSPHVGPIGLGYVRRDFAEPGTLLEAEVGPVRVSALPFVAPETP
ncbi:MAG: aminomethyl transferase family protein [Myxococcales bacterium]|nr:aminomethyl transferase family protein [Myxococcales bacterium]